MKIVLIIRDSNERGWLEATLHLSPRVEHVISFHRVHEKATAINEQATALVIVEQENFGSLKTQLKSTYSAQEVPFPILVLTPGFNSLDLNKYPELTIEAFPKHALTPQILEHLVSTSLRDFSKDQRLKKLAHFDALTGATNRHLYSDRMNQALKRAKRIKEPISLMHLDLDKFKQINDQFGHLIGDEYLKGFVQRVKECIRETDTLARLGGDEFALLLPKSDREFAETIAKRILSMLTQPLNSSQHLLTIGCSIGIVSYTGLEKSQEFTAQRVSQKADQAVYLAKRAGRNIYKFFDNKSYP
jgi:diguanylate cyclase (GGDEF)-like protein